jgi:uncharacterized phage protein (TIGR02220 family)
MFTKKVTDDDNFMALSSSAQALYLHLSMGADDDGFCNQVSVSMFKAHASIQDLEALLKKRYIYQFDNGVIVIKHWRMANALRKDRYTPTAFQEELSRLDLKDNGSYTWLPNGCQAVATCLPQDRVGKESIGNTIDSMSDSVESDTVSSEIYRTIISHLNEKCGTNYKANTAKTKSVINARLAEGFKEADFISVIEKKSREWLSDPKMEKYLRPETLFGTKFESYLNQKSEVKKETPKKWEQRKDTQPSAKSIQETSDWLDEFLANQKGGI